MMKSDALFRKFFLFIYIIFLKYFLRSTIEMKESKSFFENLF